MRISDWSSTCALPICVAAGRHGAGERDRPDRALRSGGQADPAGGGYVGRKGRPDHPVDADRRAARTRRRRDHAMNATLDPALLAKLVCTVTRMPLRWDAERSELLSDAAGLDRERTRLNYSD